MKQNLRQVRARVRQERLEAGADRGQTQVLPRLPQEGNPLLRPLLRPRRRGGTRSRRRSHQGQEMHI